MRRASLLEVAGADVSDCKRPIRSTTDDIPAIRFSRQSPEFAQKTPISGVIGKKVCPF